jgi:polysaccharide biosynthesis/export protein
VIPLPYKKILVSLLILSMISPVFAQTPDISSLKEMLPELMQKAKDAQPAAVQPALQPEAPASALEVSSIEEVLTVAAPGMPGLSQFGYQIFQQSMAGSAPDSNVPVRSDYVIGPGDSFSITLWGISEGVVHATVDREGNITLPKAGVVGVAGIRFGELDKFIAGVLRPYYQEINVSVAMDQMRSIRVYILGEVRKPGGYNLNSMSTVFNALYACGGPSKKGTLRKIKLVRGQNTIAEVDLYDFLLYGKKKGDVQLEDGDVVFVPLIGDVVGVAGNVPRPAIYEINGKVNMQNVIDLAGGFMPTSYLNRVQLQRIEAHESKSVVDIDVSKENGRLASIPIKNMDMVQIFSIYPLVKNLVYLEGKVKYPGSYELKPGMRVKDLVPSVSALVLDSYLDRAEVVRLNPGNKETEVIPFNLSKLLAGDESQNIALAPLDKIVVHAEKMEEATVTLKGEVKAPGAYAIHNGEKLSALLERAGGFTSKAFLFGSVFIRQSAKASQQGSITKMIDELERKLVAESSLNINSVNAEALVAERYARSKELLEKLRASQAQGRIIAHISDPSVLKGTKEDIILEDGDEITIPQTPSVVSVLGEVYNANSLLYEQGKNARYYIDKVGGLNKNADGGSLYVIRADGSIVGSDRYNVFNLEMVRGDTVIVPQRVEMVYDWGKGFMDSLDIAVKALTAYALVLAVTK